MAWWWPFSGLHPDEWVRTYTYIHTDLPTYVSRFFARHKRGLPRCMGGVPPASPGRMLHVF